MRTRTYGQFCGLARAMEVLEPRWTVLILRDLLLGPRRYSDLIAELPGIPTNVLATRLKELEDEGLVVREAQRGGARAIVYRTTARAEELVPVLDALSRWGAGGMREPRDGEIVTTASLASALRAARRDPLPAAVPDPVAIEVRVGDAVATASLHGTQVEVRPGAHPDPQLVVTAGLVLREVMAGAIGPAEAVGSGAVELVGDPALFDLFAVAFAAPYSDSLPTDPAPDHGASDGRAADRSGQHTVHP